MNLGSFESLQWHVELVVLASVAVLDAVWIFNQNRRSLGNPVDVAGELSAFDGKTNAIPRLDPQSFPREVGWGEKLVIGLGVPEEPFRESFEL